MKRKPEISKKSRGDIGDKQRPVIQKGQVGVAKLPRLITVFEDEGDPLEDVEYNGRDLEASASAEMSEILRGILERRAAQRERFRIARDPDYWLALCFQSRDQRDEFVRLAGWERAVVHGKYFNGLEVARILGVGIDPIPLEPLPQRGKPHNFTREEVI